MPRPPRIEFENAWYHVMNHGAVRKIMFALLFLSLSNAAAVQQEVYCETKDGFYSVLIMNYELPNLNLKAMIHEKNNNGPLS